MDLKNILNTIPEELSSSDIDEAEKKIIEIIYFNTKLPPIRSYYIVDINEYNFILNLQKDIYIENFLNNEVLTSNNLDIHVIKNQDNILLINDFLKIFGNPFDIIEYIKSFDKNIIINNDNFSDSEKLVSTFNHFNLSLSNSEELNSEEINNITEIIDNYNKNGNINENINSLKINDIVIDDLRIQHSNIKSFITE